MSTIIIDDQMIHYEVFGRGLPVFLLHGWLGSWRYWYSTAEVVSQRCRVYTLDFWGFGDSRRKNTPESIDNYSRQIISFMDYLGIGKVVLVGHSMGGMVALKTALAYPNRVIRVATVGAPIQGTSLSWPLKLTDIPFCANLFARWPWLRSRLFGFFLGEARDPAVHEIIEESLKSNADTLRLAVSSMMRTDLRHDLNHLQVPSLIVHGGQDDIVHPNQADLFHGVSAAEVAMMPNSRHFPFLDEPDLFNDLLLQFISNQTISTLPTLKVKEQTMV